MGVSRRVLGLVALASVPAIAACQLVLGLDEYTNGSNDGGGLESGAPDGGDGGIDAEALPDVFSKPVTWAHWRMPNPPGLPDDSGSTYNGATFVQLGAFTPDGGDASYSVFTDRLVAEPDAGTGLQWFFPPELNAAEKDESLAEAACAVRGGRLPTRIELVTLLDFTRAGERRMPGLENGAVGKRRYWTSSPVRPFEGSVRFWIVSFSPGESRPVAASDDQDTYIACVRGP